MLYLVTVNVITSHLPLAPLALITVRSSFKADVTPDFIDNLTNCAPYVVSKCL